MNEYITKNFTWNELTHSATAKRLGIDNSVPERYMSNVIKLCTDILQPLRDAWNAPIIVSSGFRCYSLNKAVKGAVASDHMIGCAADIRSMSDTLKDNLELFELIKKLNLPYRQLIYEYGTYKDGPDWVHVSCNAVNGYDNYPKHQILHIGVI